MDEPQNRRELRLIRKRIGLTQAAMAAQLQISQSAYEKYERGERGVPITQLENARAMLERRELEKHGTVLSTEPAQGDPTPKAGRFDRWIQSCWLVFLGCCLWLIVRIAALKAGTDFLRLGPHDEGLAMAFLMFIALTVLLANETWRRACHGLPIRNQRNAP